MSKFYQGDILAGGIVRFKFNTNSTSAVPTTLGGTPSIACYKVDSTSESTAGLTLTVDFDGVTGLNHTKVDTSADGTFYAAGADYQVVLAAGTVGGVSVAGVVVGEFSIENRTQKADIRKVLGNAATAAVSGILDTSAKYLAGTALTGRDIGASVLLSSGTGTGQILLSSGVTSANLLAIQSQQVVASGTVTFPAATLSSLTQAQVTGGAYSLQTDGSGYIKISAGTGTGQISLTSGKISEVALVDTLTSYTGNTPQTGDAYARIGADGAGLTALGDARVANLDAAVSSRMATFTLPTNFSSLSITAGGAVVLSATQPNYAPSKAGDQMDLISAPNATALAAISAALLATSVDGQAVSSILAIAKSVLAGQSAVTDNGDGTTTVVFKKADGTTPKVTLTYTTATGGRTASTIGA